MTDEELNKWIDILQKKILAYKKVFELLCDYKRKALPSFYGSHSDFNDKELRELEIFYKKFLLRRIYEEACKAEETLLREEISKEVV